MSKIDSPKHSTHHIIAKNWQFEWTNHRHNLVEIRHTAHQAIHTLFQNDILPDKIKKLIGIEYEALRDDVKTKLLNVLEEIWNDADSRYKPETHKK